ncbi:magnesium transporter CorA family protein [Mycobacterium intracellulare]|uniref:hypothetical protein n=1 Tax=Mycobacterium intracellulare TaxID=1767 RepID=UPI0013E08726|nr:hypothetical protein [Mycobacterium intracellulare]
MSVNPLRALASMASLGIDALSAGRHLPIGYWPAGADGFDAEIVDTPADGAAGDEHLYECAQPTCGCRDDHRYATWKPRVVKDRGLGVNERDGEWMDRDGDRWRYNHEAGSWQNKINRDDIATTWYNVPAFADGSISDQHGPYIEIPQSPSADGSAQSLEPLAEDSPAGPAIRAHGPAGHPILTCDDYMDAARATREKGDSIEHPNFARHWHDLAERLELAAISAAPHPHPRQEIERPRPVCAGTRPAQHGKDHFQ